MRSLLSTIRNLIPPELILASHKFRGALAAALAGYPGRHLRVIGVTGTNGKTTTCHLIASILEEAGARVGMATTINFKVAEQIWPNEVRMTTLSPFRLQWFLRKARAADCDYVVLEVTSHSIVQHRIAGIPFDCAVITNLTHDHLDYHRSFEEYRRAKGGLFASLQTSYRKPETLKVSIVNRDDPNFSYFAHFDADLVLSYGILGGDVSARNIAYGTEGSQAIFETPKGRIAIKLHLPGRFNIQNALAASAVGLSQGVSLAAIKRGLEAVRAVPGRMEKVVAGQPFSVIIDYAHTPDAFQKIYETVRPTTHSRLIHVFGAAGDRDRSKRPIMGALAAGIADIVIVTDEDPYSEDPAKIIREIVQGVRRGERKQQQRKIEGETLFTFLDRREAIAKALSLAKAGDLVLITGKGAETSMVVGSKKIPWSDRGVVQEELRKLGYG